MARSYRAALAPLPPPLPQLRRRPPRVRERKRGGWATVHDGSRDACTSGKWRRTIA